jgi:F-type H+-transporting ATPase subunit delta
MSLEMKILDQVLEDMMLVIKTYEENREFRVLLDSPIVSPEKKVSILREIFSAKVSELVLNFMLILAKKRRETHLDTIASEFVHLFKEYHKIKPIFLSSAVTLDKPTKDRIAAILLKRTGYIAEFTERVDPAIIGGFKLEMDDMTYDSTISHELKKLMLEFRENIFIGRITSSH